MGKDKFIIPKTYSIYVQPSEIEVSTRKMEGYKKFCEIIQWGRRNPVPFARDFFGVEMLDFQAWALMKTWTTPYSLWAFSRSAGKTTLDAVYLMLKSVLFNNYNSIICSGTSTQSQESFTKLEQIAKKQLMAFTGLTEFYIGNIIAKSNTDGFIHNPASFKLELFNHSTIRTVNSNIDHQRGKRANLVIFDEGGFMDENMILVYTAYTAYDSSFALGGDINIEVSPKQVPNQIMFTSSVSQVGSPFWKRYREYSRKMLLGDTRYFCAQIDADVVMDATFHGKKYPVALITQETVDEAIRNDKVKALREYYNVFQEAGNANAIIKRAWIARNSEQLIPELYNIDNESEYVLCYDSARSNDNSFMLIGKFVYDAVKGWKIKLVNAINFADIGLKRRTPMRIPEQINMIRNLWLSYNGKNIEYSKVTMFSDGGPGGSGNTIPDFLMESWYESGHDGDPMYYHPGVIDKDYSIDYLHRFPNAVKNLTVVQPTSHKSLMYESLIQNIENDLIIFPDVYDHHGFLNMTEVDTELINTTKERLINEGKTEVEIATILNELDSVKTKKYQLNPDEEIALVQLDMMKEEAVNICRFKTEGAKDRFGLPPHKTSESSNSEQTMHDDRAYTLALLSWALTLRRSKERLSRQGKGANTDVAKRAPMRKATRFSMIG